MKFNSKKSVLVLATSLALGVSSMANAAATITNLDGSFSFSGFDWSALGQGWVSGYDITNASPTGFQDQFTLTYQATAVAIRDSSGANIVGASTPGLGTTYEYTIFAQVTETATCFSLGVTTCDAVSFSGVTGSYSIYYDTNVATFANYAAGTGFVGAAGTQILGGNIFAASPVIVPQGATNPGTASVSPALFGNVTMQDLSVINPTLDMTTATSTLQFVGAITQPWSPALAYNGVATGPNTNTSYQGQMDANQSFATVPEPASLALLGLGLLGVVGARRRNTK